MGAEYRSRAATSNRGKTAQVREPPREAVDRRSFGTELFALTTRRMARQCNQARESATQKNRSDQARRARRRWLQDCWLGARNTTAPRCPPFRMRNRSRSSLRTISASTVFRGSKGRTKPFSSRRPAWSGLANSPAWPSQCGSCIGISQTSLRQRQQRGISSRPSIFRGRTHDVESSNGKLIGASRACSLGHCCSRRPMAGRH
jgi:hypothetical protein